MPRTLPAGMSAMIARQGGFGEVALLDIITVDGTKYFWTDSVDPTGAYPGKIVGGNQTYVPYLKSAGPFQSGRDFTTDAGDIVVQNLSGNLIDREIAAALVNHEFEGALAVLRLWLPLFADVMFEFDGYLSEQQIGEDEISFRLLQLDDVSQFNVADDVVSELCTWRYKSLQCGSTGAATVCNKQFSTCKDANHNAQERYNGIPTPPPSNALVNIPPVNTVPGRTPGGQGGSPGDNPAFGPGGRFHPILPT